MLTVLLLIISNTFMTFAWYGASEGPFHADRHRRPRQLADCARRILLSGPGQQNRVRPVRGIPAQDYSGSDYAGRLRHLRLVVFRRTDAVELRRVLRLSLRRGGVRVLGPFLGVSRMLIGRWHVDIFPLGWSLIALVVLVVLVLLGQLGLRVFQKFTLTERSRRR